MTIYAVQSIDFKTPLVMLQHKFMH